MLFLLLACGDKETSSSDSGEAEAAGYLAELEGLMVGYEDWDQTEQWLGPQPSETVHGPQTEIWWNETAFATLDAQAGGDMPVGSIIVKQAYGDDVSELRNLTSMYKPSEEYGWLWTSWDPSGEVLLNGKEDYCSSCHAAGQDGVMVVTW